MSEQLFSDEEIARIVAQAPPWDNGPDTSAFERMAIDLRSCRSRCAALSAQVAALTKATRGWIEAWNDLRIPGDDADALLVAAAKAVSDASAAARAHDAAIIEKCAQALETVALPAPERAIRMGAAAIRALAAPAEGER